jgi:hypothetical protein
MIDQCCRCKTAPIPGETKGETDGGLDSQERPMLITSSVAIHYLDQKDLLDRLPGHCPTEFERH